MSCEGRVLPLGSETSLGLICDNVSDVKVLYEAELCTMFKIWTYSEAVNAKQL